MESTRQGQSVRTATLVGRHFRKARQTRGLSQAELAEKIGTSQNQISTIEHEQSGTSLRTATAAARTLNVSLDYLVGWADDPTPPMELKVRLAESLARLADLDPGPNLDPETGLDPADEDFIAVNEIICSPGTGETVIDERIISRTKFPRYWLNAHGLDARLCRIIRMYGESMEPTLPDSAAMLVDMDSREPRDRRIFVVRVEEELLVRRLSRHPEGAWLLKADNPDKRVWPTRPRPDDARIVGEVRWMGRSFS